MIECVIEGTRTLVTRKGLRHFVAEAFCCCGMRGMEVLTYVTFIGARPAVLATENVARRACAFARICARGKNNRLQSLLRAERRK